MGQSIDLNFDIGAGLLVAGGSAFANGIPTLTRNDGYTLRMRLLERDAFGVLRDASLGTPSLKLGIGNVDDKPSDGQFRLTLSGPVTSSAIPFNASTAQVLNAVSAIAGNVTVTTYGSETNAWVITAVTVNTALTWGGDSYTLFPSSSVLISTRRAPAANVEGQYVVQLARNPAVLATSFSASSTAGAVSLTKLQDGDSSTNKNEVYRLSVGPDAIGGSIVLAYGNNAATGVVVGSSAASFSEALSAVTGIGAGNISVQADASGSGYTITFVRNLGQTNITTGLTVDASSVIFAKYYEATVTMGTAELDELFAEAGTNTITPTLEIELTDGTPRTLWQGDVTVRRDLISQSASVPASRESYYTKSEIDAFVFLKNSTTGFELSGNNRTLYNASGSSVVRVDNIGVGFFANSPAPQPAGPNVVTGLISLGLLSSGTTWGVLPLSTGTLTTTASLDFGNVVSHGSTVVTAPLTGAVEGSLILLGLPNSTCAGLVFQASVSASGVVKITALNVTSNSVTQSAQTFRLTAFGY